jgi:putative FmdB family regulatory protein
MFRRKILGVKQMPTYDYKCTECDYKFELFQPMSAEPLKECPSCKGKVKRLIGAGAGPIFKGTGFYQTDYKNSGSSKSKGSGKKDDSAGTSTPQKDSNSTTNKENPTQPGKKAV